MVFRIRQKPVAQRIELINALRSHLHEFGYIAPVGLRHLPKLVEVFADEVSDFPNVARRACRGLLDQTDTLSGHPDALNEQIADLGREGETSRTLQTMPGVGPVTALAIEAFAPPMERFRRGRDLAAWPGLVPRQGVRRPSVVLRSNLGARPDQAALVLAGSVWATPSVNLTPWATRGH